MAVPPAPLKSNCRVSLGLWGRLWAEAEEAFSPSLHGWRRLRPGAFGVSVSELKSHSVDVHRTLLREDLFCLFFMVFAKIIMIIAKTYVQWTLH